MDNTLMPSSTLFRHALGTKKRRKRRCKGRKNTLHATITTIAACVAVTFCYTTTTQAFSSLVDHSRSLSSSSSSNPRGPLPLHLLSGSSSSSSSHLTTSHPPGFPVMLFLGKGDQRIRPFSSSLQRSSLAAKTMSMLTEGDIRVREKQRQRQRLGTTGKSVNAAAAAAAAEKIPGGKNKLNPEISSSGTFVRERHLNDLYRLTSSYGVLHYSDEIQQNKQGRIVRGSDYHSNSGDVETRHQTETESKSSSCNTSSSSSSSSVSPVYFNSQGKKNGRSSTMPGFINDKTSQRHQSFRDGLSIAKEANDPETANRIQKILTSEKELQRRRKANSEAMYSSSASVPDSFVAFANEIHQVSRITPKDEIELGTKTQEAIRIQQIRDDLEVKLRREPTNSEWCVAAGMEDMDALEGALKEGLEAKQRLVTSNLRMVQRVVNLYIRNGLGSQYNAGDLMQEGIIALIRAAEKFEPSRGFRFSTYAMYWIRAAVKRSQIIQSRVISVPQRLHETHKKITKIEYELKKELGRNPKKSELADAVGITKMQLDRCLAAIAQQCLSLDAELENTVNPNKSNSNKDTLYNILAAKYDNVEFKQLKSDLLKEDLIDSLRRYLSPREVDLLLLRYGLMDEKTLQFGFSGPLTIAEVSRLVGLKPDKVRRIINKSLRQLRHLIAHEWEDFEKELS